MNYHSEYYGIMIFKNTAPGYQLKYSARLNNGDKIVADTLEGIKKSIKDRIR